MMDSKATCVKMARQANHNMIEAMKDGIKGRAKFWKGNRRQWMAAARKAQAQG